MARSVLNQGTVLNSSTRYIASLLLTLPFAANAQTATWQVINGERGDVLAADLPVGTFRTFADLGVGNAGAGQFGFRVASPTALEGYWASRNGRFTRYTQVAVTGNLGPGRSGPESAHQFVSVNTGQGDASSDGQRAFMARAADPANPNAASYGLWRWNTTSNIEIARMETDGVLGPGLGAGFRFLSSAGFAEARMADGGVAVINALVNSPSNVQSQVLLKHVPGQANLACLQTGSTNPALSPGLTGTDTFQTFNAGLERVAVTTNGRVHARLVSSTLREGIWELCNGAPRALAVTSETGIRGPDVGIVSATFVDVGLTAPQPSGTLGLIFLGQWRTGADATNRPGLFRFDGSGNRGIAYTEASGFFGPNWLNSTWRSFNGDYFSVAGMYTAIIATVNATDGGTPTGLWRIRAGERPQLIALLAISGAPYEPEPGRTWRNFEAVAVLSNGDIVVEATTNPNSTKDLWILRQGQAPRRLLSPGQTLSVPTAQGTTATALSTFDLADGGARFSDGTDGWIGADGTLVLSVNSTTFGRLHISQRLDLPSPDRVFKSGFE